MSWIDWTAVATIWVTLSYVAARKLLADYFRAKLAYLRMITKELENGSNGT